MKPFKEHVHSAKPTCKAWPVCECGAVQRLGGNWAEPPFSFGASLALPARALTRLEQVHKHRRSTGAGSMIGGCVCGATFIDAQWVEPLDGYLPVRAVDSRASVSKSALAGLKDD